MTKVSVPKSLVIEWHSVDVILGVKKVFRPASIGMYQILAKLIQAEGTTLYSDVCKLTAFGMRRTVHSSGRNLLFTSLLNNIIINHIKVFFNILLSALTPSVDEVIYHKQILCIPLRLMKVQESNGHCISLFIDFEKACDSGDNYCARHWILCNGEAV